MSLLKKGNLIRFGGINQAPPQQNPNLIENGNLSSFTGVAGTVKGDYSFTTVTDFSGVYLDLSGLIVGAAYIASIEFGALDVGSDRVYIYESSSFGAVQSSAQTSQNSVVEIIFNSISSSQRLYLRRNTAGTDEINSISVTRIF